MNPVEPWLDPSEVRHLAEQLLRPVPSETLEATDPGFDSSFVGFASPTQTGASIAAPTQEDTAAQPKPTVKSPHAATDQEKETEAALPLPPFNARFLERIRILRDWLEKNLQATDIFILDHEGKIVFDESRHGRFHLMARNLADASTRSGNIHVKIGPTAILQVVPCETHFGRIILGTLVPEILPLAHIHTITELLVQTASPA